MTAIRSIGLATGTEGRLSAEIATAVGHACESLGVAARRVNSLHDVDGLDALLGIAYPDYYPLLRARSCPVRRYAWLGEPLPPPGERRAERFIRPLRVGRILDAAIMATGMGDPRRAPPTVVRWRERAASSRDQTHNLAAHRVAARNGLGLVVTSRDRARTLARFGIDAPVVPYGYDAALAGEPTDPATDRDIDVLVIGTSTTGVPTRRARITAETLGALDPTVRTLVVEDGAWGNDRHALLRRARVVLNVHRVAGNFTGIRSVLAGAAGATVVSEPVDTPYPFVPGIHYLEARPEQLAETIADILADRPHRLAVARAAQTLVVEHLTMRRSVRQLLEAIG